MSTGISMSSVNKIKELADNGDYSLALDILEHQDLSKSLSPQFIRICGEVYYENKRYPEARAALVKAHAMAPAGNKIIYSLVKLYLSMGFANAEKSGTINLPIARKENSIIERCINKDGQ